MLFMSAIDKSFQIFLDFSFNSPPKFPDEWEDVE